MFIQSRIYCYLITRVQATAITEGVAMIDAAIILSNPVIFHFNLSFDEIH